MVIQLDKVPKRFPFKVSPVTHTKHETPISTDELGSLNTYSPPRVRDFGSIGTLTQAGSGPMFEGGQSMGVDRTPMV